VLIVTQI